MINNRIGLTCAYALNLGKYISLRAGVSAGVHHRKVHWEKLAFGDQIDPRRGFIYNTHETPITDPAIFPEAGAGLLLSGNNFDAGIAIDHLNRADESFKNHTPFP